MSTEDTRTRFQAVLERMRDDRVRFRVAPGGSEVVSANAVDDWADELQELSALLVQEAPQKEWTVIGTLVPPTTSGVSDNGPAERALAVPEAESGPAWQPIANPPKVEGTHSHRFLGVLASGHHVFCQYTPFYLGREDEYKGLWVCEGSPWATKPTHWMPLPVPPSAAQLVPAAPQQDETFWRENYILLRDAITKHINTYFLRGLDADAALVEVLKVAGERLAARVNAARGEV